MTARPPASLDQVHADHATSGAPLRERLAALQEASARQYPDFVAAAEALIARLNASGVGLGAPQVGDEMPPFRLPDDSGRLVGLQDLLAEGPAVVIFHRGHWCPYCQSAGLALAAAEPAVAALGGRMAAILPDRQAYAARFKAQTGAAYPFLTDLDNGYALALNLVFWMGDELATLYQRDGDVIPLYHGNAAWFLPIPATFVVGRDGRVVARFVDPDYRRRMEIDDLVAAVAAAR